jgi:hypothetical protein
MKMLAGSSAGRVRWKREPDERPAWTVPVRYHRSRMSCRAWSGTIGREGDAKQGIACQPIARAQISEVVYGCD